MTDVSDGIQPLPHGVQISAEIDRVLTERAHHATHYGPDFVALWRHTKESALGGKLLRPRLLLGAYEALIRDRESGPLTDHAAAVRLAAATEILHYAFLLHDDVIDGDLTRRGRPNLMGAVLQDRAQHADALDPGRKNADRHWAETSGILMGDLLLALAHQLIAREVLPQEARIRLLDLLEHTIVDSVAGEHLDVGLSTGVVPAEWETVLRMSQLKTATYTFEFPLRGAAILAGAPPELDPTLSALGRALGLAFQLQDDLLSTFGHAHEHGKDAFSDLREGKETALIAHARGTADWTHIEPLFGGPLNFEQCVAIREHLRACGAEQTVTALIAEHVTACEELCAAAGSDVPRPFADFITQLLTELHGRRA